MAAYDVAVIVGSLRKGSYNRMMAHALAAFAPPSLKLEIVEIGALPLYDQDEDEDADPPAAWTAFRERIRPADAVLFVTPEYNRSVPAPLKNAIDVGLRPYGKSVWDGKPAAIGRVRRQSPPAPVAGVPQHAAAAAARGLYGRRRKSVRRRGQADKSRHCGFFEKIHAGFCCLD
jgi:NADPH-dependent FMN reductase